jgi:hypothetical protein
MYLYRLQIKWNYQKKKKKIGYQVMNKKYIFPHCIFKHENSYKKYSLQLVAYM